MFAQLGQHTFTGLKAPESWGETHAVRIGRTSRINGRDALQHTGAELSEISLSIRYSTDFCTPAAEIEALKKSMREAEILPFLSGDGAIIGSYIITAADVANETFSPAGELLCATVALKLLEHPDGSASPTPAASRKRKSIPAGTALKSKAPATEAPALQPVSASPAGSITADLSAARTSVSKMKATVAQVKKSMTTVRRGVQDVKKLAADVSQLYASAKTKLAATRRIAARARELPDSLSGAIRYAENLSNLSTAADTRVLEMNVDELSRSADRVSRHAAPVVSFVATREGGK